MPAGRTRWLVAGVVAVACAVVIAVVSTRTPAPGESVAATPRGDPSAALAEPGRGGDPALIAAIPRVRPGVVTRDVSPAAAAGGAPLRDGEGNALFLQAGATVAVLEGPVAVEGAGWFRIYVLANEISGPGEYLGWLPDGTVDIGAIPDCPGGEIEAAAQLDPFNRATCLGAAPITIRGWVRDRVLPTWYRITPEWFGEQNGQAADATISLHAERQPNRGFGGAAIEVQVAPGLERPPYEFQIDVIAHVGDALSRTCERRPDQFGMVPPDDAGFATTWCATRVVMERWVPLLGPEERPLDPIRPQLHRHPDAGLNVGCAGVGMPPLIFRMDATKADPVWLEVADEPGTHIVPNFDPGFQVGFEPALVIKDELGQVVARDGTPVNPDGQIAGHSICPTGRVVYFD